MNYSNPIYSNARIREQWLSNDTVSDWREFPSGRCACIERINGGLFYLKADLSYFGNDNAWAYRTYAAARAALDAWDGDGEPEGWHRHPQTGRRRENGDPAREVIRR